MHERELVLGIGAVFLLGAGFVALWAPADWAAPGLVLAADIAGGLIWAGLVGLAIKARFDFVRAPEAGGATVAGSIAVGAVFALMLTLFFAGATYALTTKHEVVTAFGGAVSRTESVAFWLEQALKGALFDVFEVFGVSIPGAPRFDGRAQPILGAVVVAFRFAAALGVWSLIFALAGRRRR